MFRVRKVIGKQFFAGGFGMTLLSNKDEGGDSSSSKNNRQSSEYLFLEESLFLSERGVLQVYSEQGELLHLQRLYEMLETTRVPISIYLTYAHLRRQDYRVLRHVPDASMTKDSKEARRTMVLTTLNEDASSIAFDVYPPNTHFKRTDPGIPHLQVAVASFQLPSLTFFELQTLSQKSGTVPLKIATVSDSGVVVMFAVTSNVGVVPTIHI
jgi:tRNA-splicing endonuclease subunit Sen54